MDAAIPAWIAAGCNPGSGHELAGDEGKLHGGLTSAAAERELNARAKFKISQLLKGGAPSKSSRKMVDGKRDVKDHMVAEGYEGPGAKGGSKPSPLSPSGHFSRGFKKMKYLDPRHQAILSSN